MQSLKTWAKTVYLVAVLSSAALLMIPRSMQKQSKFVIELLLLLCILAPTANLARKSFDISEIPWDYHFWYSDSASFETLYAREVERQVKELSSAAGFSVHSVHVEIGGFAPEFSVEKIILRLAHPIDPQDLDRDQLARLFAARFSVKAEKVCFKGLEDGGL